MLVENIKNRQQDLPNKFQKYAFGQDQQGSLPLAIGKKYVVSAIKAVEGVDFYLIIGDKSELKGDPWWYPASLFTTIDDTTPDDWVSVAKNEDSSMTGFKELVNDPRGEFYNALEDGEAGALAVFLKHYEKYARHHSLWYVDGKPAK